MKHTFLIMIALTLFSTVTGCSPTGNSSKPSLEVINHSLSSSIFSTSSPESIASVSGTARNSGSSIIGTATLTITMYDKNDSVMDTLSASRENLAPGETWIFAVQSKGPDAWKIIRYELSASTK